MTRCPTPSTEPPRTTRRRFTLRDMLILVAAFALGAAIHRECSRYWATSGVFSQGFRSLEGFLDLLNDLTLYLPAWLFSASLALFVIRWLPPRPEPVRLLRQPGAVASLAVVAASTVALIVS